MLHAERTIRRFFRQISRHIHRQPAHRTAHGGGGHMVRCGAHPVARPAAARAMLHLLFALGLLMTLVGGAWAQTEAMVTRRATELRSAPGDASAVTTKLEAQSSVTRLAGRSGPWMEVRASSGEQGWVHMFDLGAPGSSSSGGNVASGFLRGVTGFFSRAGSSGQGSTVATSTIGIRGLDAHDLANAQPNANAVQDMEALRQNAAQAQQFAGTAGLQARPEVAVDAAAAEPAGQRP